MSARVLFTKAAKADLIEIKRPITKQGGAERARIAIGRIRELISILEDQPEAGSVPEELASLGVRGFRQLVSKPYLVIYTYTREDVYVLLVADGRRDFRSLLERRLLA